MYFSFSITSFYRDILCSFGSRTYLISPTVVRPPRSPNHGRTRSIAIVSNCVWSSLALPKHTYNYKIKLEPRVVWIIILSKKKKKENFIKFRKQIMNNMHLKLVTVFTFLSVVIKQLLKILFNFSKIHTYTHMYVCINI